MRRHCLPRLALSLATVLLAILATLRVRAADSVDWDRQANEDAKQDFTTIIFDGQPPRLCLLPGKTTFPTGSIGGGS
jgi:hypothetical protein